MCVSFRVKLPWDLGMNEASLGRRKYLPTLRSDFLENLNVSPDNNFVLSGDIFLLSGDIFLFSCFAR